MTTIDLKPKANDYDRSDPQGSSAASAAAEKQMSQKLAAVPTCGNCGTEAYLYIEEFSPARMNDEGELLQLAEAGYFCTRCLRYGAHSVPPLWTPDNRG